MKAVILPIVIAMSLTCLESCYVAKPLDREVHITINNDFPVTIKNTGSSNFSAKHTEAEYRQAYLNGLKAELTSNHILIDETATEFVVKINSLELHESTKIDTVKDEKSKDNGLIRDLTLAGLKTSGTISRVGSTISTNWEAEKNKDEKLNNNQNVGQILLGQNKDNTVYTEKGFDDNEFVVQSGHCGRRAAVKITHEIQSLLK